MVWHSDTVNDLATVYATSMTDLEDCCLLASSIDANLLFVVLCMWWISCVLTMLALFGQPTPEFLLKLRLLFSLEHGLEICLVVGFDNRGQPVI